MKYSFTRKINLANIDRDLWPYETEDIGISDADSFEEAQQQVDKIVHERIGYYKAISETKNQKVPEKSSGADTNISFTPAPTASAPAPSATTPPPAVETTGPVPTTPVNPGGAEPPKEFQV